MPKIAVVVPCYRVSRQAANVVASIGPEVDRIFVVDDACPEQTGKLISQSSGDARVRVMRTRV